MLRDEYNIKVVWQVPQSPETNLLDLGVWMGLQSHVERLHRCRTKTSAKALARTVEEAWRMYDSYQPFRNVYKRWDKVLRLIVAGNGDNVLVDKARKKVLIPIVIQPPQNTSGAADQAGDNDNDEVDLFDEDEDIAREELIEEDD